MTSSRQLEGFVTLANHLSVTKAAHQLHISPSAVSHDLKQLRMAIATVESKLQILLLRIAKLSLRLEVNLYLRLGRRFFSLTTLQLVVASHDV